MLLCLTYSTTLPSTYPLHFFRILAHLQLAEYPGLEVWISFFEIYGGKLFDLLHDRNKLVSREDADGRVNVVGLQEVPCFSVDELIDLIGKGKKNCGMIQ